jgi:DNA helicase II / ATP-dependent DNA helicase PcrA
VAVKTQTKKLKPARQQPQRQSALPKAVAGSTPATHIAFAVGDRVSHPQFGDGTITAIEDHRLTIAFDMQGGKQIIDSYVRRLKKT